MRRSSVLSSILTLGVLLGAYPALAQTSGGRGVPAQVFSPAADGYGIFAVDRPETARQFEFGFKFFTNFASSPLRLSVPTELGGSDLERRAIIDWQAAFNFQVYTGILDDLELFIDLPVARQSLGSGFGDDTGESLTGFYAGSEGAGVDPPKGGPLDSRLGFKYRLWRDGTYAVAVQALATLPFGENQGFMGERSFTYQPKVIAAAQLGKVAVAANLGAVLRQKTERIYDPYALPDTPRPLLGVGHEITVGAGATYRLNKYVAFALEGYSGLPVNEVTDTLDGVEYTFDRDPYADLLGGCLFYPLPDIAVSLGAGGGIIPNSARADTFRIFAGVAWSPEAIEKTQSDRDADGIFDDQDACPEEPEDVDGYQDKDGCPDPDNDGDRIADGADKCPTQAEDGDGFADTDGCPDADNDNDGIADVRDKCPREPEDIDGYQDEDGCRDDDNDGDGMPDKDDKCPNEPESYNTYEDDDGCPDQLPTEIGPKAGVPLKLGNVAFIGRSARINRKSLPILDRLAADMKKWVRLRLRIESHTDDRGKPARLVALSRARAEAVRQYLAGKGVDPERLIAEGYGGARPIKSNKTRAGRAANDRIEFIPIEQ